MRIRFSEIQNLAPKSPGLYEIFTNDGRPLKVGIAANLRSRLRQHAKSCDSALKLKRQTDEPTPSDVVSKASILAKHLFFDSEITDEYDLSSEKGRQDFLEECCYLNIRVTDTKDPARSLERQLERSGGYRYVGRVVAR